MKKTILVLIALVFNALCLNAQIWQKTYGIPNHYEIAMGTVNSYDNGFIVGINRDSRAVILLKASINGDILWQKTLKDITGKLFIIQSTANPSISANYLTGGIYDTGVNTFILNIDNCGNLKWCKKIVLNDDNFGYYIKTTLSQNIRLLTFGASDYLGIDRFQLWEIDPDGNILWMKQVLPGMQTYFQNTDFYQMCLTSDGGSLIAGYTYYPYDTTNNPYDAVLQPCLVKCDSQGEMQWVYPPLGGADTTKFGFFTSCTQIGNSYYAAGSHYQLGTEFFLRPLVARFDLDGNLLSYNYTQADSMYHELTQVVSATDTSLLLISAANTVFNDPNYLMVFIADTMGNFQKSFTRTDLVVGQFGDEVAKMRDNKFVIPCQSPLGWPGPLTDVVAIKLNANLEYDSIYTQPFTYDSLCPYTILSDTILCNCEPFVSVKEAESTTLPLNIYPNPASGNFVVDFGKENITKSILTVYDIYGRIKYKIELPAGIKQSTINCENWIPGLYLIKFQSGIKTKIGKIMVN
jgi:hypothetical protein